MYDILDFIDSPDIRDYHRNTNFTPAQQAVLIARSEKTTVEEKIKALSDILSNYSISELRAETLYDTCGGASESCGFQQVLAKTIEIWKEVLMLREDDIGAVYAVQLAEKNYFRNSLCAYEFYSDYKKAYQYLLDEKQCYLKENDLAKVETYGEIYRIPLDDIEGDHMNWDRFRFDNGMRLVCISASNKRCSLKGESGWLLDDYSFYLPLPFQKGDRVIAESPFYRSYEGIFFHDLENTRGHQEFITSISCCQLKEEEAEYYNHVEILHLRKMVGVQEEIEDS